MINSERPMTGLNILSRGSKIIVLKEYNFASFAEVFVEKLPFLFFPNLPLI